MAILSLMKIAGCSVRSIQSNAGWQEQSSNLQIDLVEDTDNGDNFTYPTPGTPLAISLEGMYFGGLVQNWSKDQSVSGNPVFSLTLYSPAEILENVQVILQSYRGVNTVMPNLLNVFGYLEGSGLGDFGGSGRNESGISFYRIRSAIEGIQLGATNFSPGIIFKGHTYMVDFTNFPTPPDFYRVAGDFVSLNQIIRTVMEDSGYDYIVGLTVATGTGPHIINFKTRSRLIQQPLGQVGALIENSTDINSAQQSAELRNDVTSGVIFGGDREEAYAMLEFGDGSVIHPYWGESFGYNLIPFITQGNLPIVDSTVNGNLTLVNLNAAPIADIIGGYIYQCTIYEMRFALANFDSWTCFILRKRPELAEFLGFDSFPSIFGLAQYDNNPQSMYAVDPFAVSVFTNNYSDTPFLRVLHRIYDFVRNSAEIYLGKQFLVRIPFLLKYAFEEETNIINYNFDVSSDGYWPDYVGGGSGPLGLAYYNFNAFMNDNGKFRPFVKFSSADLAFANVSALNPTTSVIQNNEIFMQCNVDTRIIFAPVPAVLVTLAEPILSIWPDPVGGILDIAWLLDMDPEVLAVTLEMNNGVFPISIHPGFYGPTGATICLKSNEYTYGPWVKLGVPGKVKVTQDPGLVPWNYGSFETMNQAANAQLADIGSVLQVEEGGSLVQPGLPSVSLGEALNTAGPPVTSIDVSISTSGILTTYRMRSQTPTFGAFSKQNADRLRRLGTASQDMRRSMRSLFDRIRQTSQIVNQSQAIFNANISRAIDQREANNVFQSFSIFDPDTQQVTHQVSGKSFAASLGSSQVHNPDKFKNVASMGLEGILRPFSTNTEVLPSGTLAHYETPVAGTTITNVDLNPFKQGTDIMWGTSGDQFGGNYIQRDVVDPDNMRVMALRGPLILDGHGYDIQGNPVPNENTDNQAKLNEMTGNHLENYLKKSQKWKVGAADLRWNKFNKTWVSPGCIIDGIYKGLDVSSGKYRVLINGFTNEYLIIANPDILGSAIPIVNKTVMCGFNPFRNAWMILSASC